MKPQIDIDMKVTATDNKLRTGVDAEISIAKLTGYAMSRIWGGEDSPQHLKVIEWAACKLVEIGVVDPMAAEEAYRKQEDRFVSLHMRKYSNIHRGRRARHLHQKGIVNTYKKSRLAFYKDRFPEDVAMAQAKHEFERLVLRLRKEKITLRAIAERFDISPDMVRQAEAVALRKNKHPCGVISPIEHYFNYNDLLTLKKR